MGKRSRPRQTSARWEGRSRMRQFEQGGREVKSSKRERGSLVRKEGLLDVGAVQPEREKREEGG